MKTDMGLNYLKEEADDLGVSDACNVLLDDKRFSIWSGSSKPEQHHYGDESDAEKFSKLVAKMGGKFEKYVQIDFLNFKNEPVGFGQYVCIYQFHTDIEMEVLT